MVKTCCIPSCRSNYPSTKNEGYFSCFSFPNDEQRKELWMRAIPRNFIPTKNSFVCEKHFDSDDIIKFDKHLQADGTIKLLLLRSPKLKEGAIPKIFPNLPSYLTKPKQMKRTDPQCRREALFTRNNNEIEDFLSSDLIKDYMDLFENYSAKINISGWEIKKCDNAIYFYILNYEKSLSVESSIEINKSLQIKIFHKDVQISANDLKWILPSDLILSRWSEVDNLLSRYKNVSNENINKSASDLLSDSLTSLEAFLSHKNNENFDQLRQLEIITDQLRQISRNKIRYSSSTIIMSFILYSQSASCYELMRKFFILPNKRYLRSISSSLEISANSDSSNKNYLSNVSRELPTLDRVVVLLIDEIYINSRLENFI